MTAEDDHGEMPNDTPRPERLPAGDYSEVDLIRTEFRHLAARIAELERRLSMRERGSHPDLGRLYATESSEADPGTLFDIVQQAVFRLNHLEEQVSNHERVLRWASRFIGKTRMWMEAFVKITSSRPEPGESRPEG